MEAFCELSSGLDESFRRTKKVRKISMVNMDPTAGGIYGLLGWECDICVFKIFHATPWYSVYSMCAEGPLEELGTLCPHFREASVRLVVSRGATWVTWQTMGTCCALVSTSFCSMYSIQILGIL